MRLHPPPIWGKWNPLRYDGVMFLFLAAWLVTLAPVLWIYFRVRIALEDHKKNQGPYAS